MSDPVTLAFRNFGIYLAERVVREAQRTGCPGLIREYPVLFEALDIDLAAAEAALRRQLETAEQQHQVDQ